MSAMVLARMPEPQFWTHARVFGLAKVSCYTCHGYGLRTVHERPAPCHCVFRAIFRACYNQYRECAMTRARTTQIGLEYRSGKDGRRFYSRTKEEYLADFVLVSKRVLDRSDYRIFRFRFLLGADWRACCRSIGMDRGNFFHAVYRIEQQLGRVFAELEPYSLYPVDEYFGSWIRNGLRRAA